VLKLSLTFTVGCFCLLFALKLGDRVALGRGCAHPVLFRCRRLGLVLHVFSALGGPSGARAFAVVLVGSEGTGRARGTFARFGGVGADKNLAGAAKRLVQTFEGVVGAVADSCLVLEGLDACGEPSGSGKRTVGKARVSGRNRYYLARCTQSQTKRTRVRPCQCPVTATVVSGSMASHLQSKGLAPLSRLAAP
jgi:hypothetical protein